MSDGSIPNIPGDAIDALYPPGGLLAALRVDCSEWMAYIDHEFVRRLADGSLPEAAFRHYLIQDYLFLKHFARAYALAAYKGETLDEILGRGPLPLWALVAPPVVALVLTTSVSPPHSVS